MFPFPSRMHCVSFLPSLPLHPLFSSSSLIYCGVFLAYLRRISLAYFYACFGVFCLICAAYLPYLLGVFFG
ncbi:hypothetical protein C8R44DRAFT_814080 [Mycena epipterygia]|nr:hypothetical protein C8R44DRAFT_814080 [Mycena epipterygia]